MTTQYRQNNSQPSPPQSPTNSSSPDHGSSLFLGTIQRVKKRKKREDVEYSIPPSKRGNNDYYHHLNTGIQLSGELPRLSDSSSDDDSYDSDLVRMFADLETGEDQVIQSASQTQTREEDSVSGQSMHFAPIAIQGQTESATVSNQLPLNQQIIRPSASRAQTSFNTVTTPQRNLT